MRARVRGALGCENATEDKTEAEDVRIVVRVVLRGSVVGGVG
jgi:hypothetical protein